MGKWEIKMRRIPQNKAKTGQMPVSTSSKSSSAGKLVVGAKGATTPTPVNVPVPKINK